MEREVIGETCLLQRLLQLLAHVLGVERRPTSTREHELMIGIRLAEHVPFEGLQLVLLAQRFECVRRQGNGAP